MLRKLALANGLSMSSMVRLIVHNRHREIVANGECKEKT
jgi:hypothetical protein